MSDTDGNAAAIISAIESHTAPEIVGIARGDSKNASVLVTPTGKKVHDLKPFLDKYLERPERMTGYSKVSTLQSFEEHVNRHKHEHSVAFIDDFNRDAPSMRAIYDYNEAGAGKPGWREHGCVYPFPLSEEWIAWREIAKAEWLTQEQLALFLEDRMVDVLDPATALGMSATVKHISDLGLALAGPSKLLELARGLDITVALQFKQTVNLDSGEKRVSFEEQHTDKGKDLVVPNGFAIGIPVFVDGAAYPMAIRLRYRAAGQKVVWRLMPHRPDQIFRIAITGVEERFKVACKVPVFHGTPES